MCGFRSLSEISAHLEEYPELHGLIYHSEGMYVCVYRVYVYREGVYVYSVCVCVCVYIYRVGVYMGCMYVYRVYICVL
jgi:hypothetical protein